MLQRPSFPVLPLSVAVFALSMLAGCATTTYQSYAEGQVQTGAGGEHEVVDGIEIWQQGAPAQPYRVVGMIDDERSASPLAAVGRLRSYASRARQAGGQAILINPQHDLQAPTPGSGFGRASVFDNAYGAVPGISGAPQSSAFGSAFSTVHTHALVIRYVQPEASRTPR